MSQETLEFNGLKSRDIDYMIPHQANTRIIEAAAKMINFPMEKVYLNIDRFGNTSSATIPIALDEMNLSGMLKRGNLHPPVFLRHRSHLGGSPDPLVKTRRGRRFTQVCRMKKNRTPKDTDFRLSFRG